MNIFLIQLNSLRDWVSFLKGNLEDATQIPVL